MQGSIRPLLEYLGRLGRPSLLALSYACVALIGTLDYLVGYEVSFSPFYLFPVSVVTWFIGFRSGIVMSMVSAVVWQVAYQFADSGASSTIIPYWNSAMRLVFFLIVTFLISKLKQMLEQEQRSARTDFLTTVANARAFRDSASTELLRSARYNHPLTMCYIDLDNFKYVNDTFGHSEGDTVLQSAACIIKDHLRATDVVARLGGDEFAIMLPQTDAAAAHLIINKIQVLLLKRMELDRWPVTFSIGVLTCMTPPDTVDELIRIADNLMYNAKASEKGTIQFATYPDSLRSKTG